MATVAQLIEYLEEFKPTDRVVVTTADVVEPPQRGPHTARPWANGEFGCVALDIAIEQIDDGTYLTQEAEDAEDTKSTGGDS